MILLVLFPWLVQFNLAQLRRALPSRLGVCGQNGDNLNPLQGDYVKGKKKVFGPEYQLGSVYVCVCICGGGCLQQGSREANLETSHLQREKRAKCEDISTISPFSQFSYYNSEVTYSST